jgi:hypothetical protein
MKCFRRTAGYTLFDRKGNEEMLEELRVEPVDKKLYRRRSNYLGTYEKNEQKQNAKHDDELWTK